MVTHTPPPPPPSHLHPAKRARHSSSPGKESPPSPPAPPPAAGAANSPPDELAAEAASGTTPGSHHGSKGSQGSNFRNVSACNRCRLRKNRCDQKLPSCASCEKANVACVGYDPITRKEIPRSYVFYLETRAEQLEALLSSHNIPFPAAENLEYCSKSHSDLSTARPPTEAGPSSHPDAQDTVGGPSRENNGGDASRAEKQVFRPDLSGTPVAANPRHLGTISGVSFARVVFAAVQSSVSDQKSSSDKTGVRPYKPGPGGGGTSMRDSFFGLHTKPTIHPATFPDKALGGWLAKLYFEHANPQIPVLHGSEFQAMFNQAYAEDGSRVRGPKELYVLNMVFAIGGAIIMGDSARGDSHASRPPPGGETGSKQCQPEEYHASAIMHLEACLSNSGGGLAELQAVLLLANFALLRPVPPGLWYIVGVAMRLAVDLGLHHEDVKDAERDVGDPAAQTNQNYRRERGRREYTRDLRRRLWWCTYSLDRLVGVCVGRPLGISDEVITTEFPSLLKDQYITATGFLDRPTGAIEPTYKLVAHHYFRLRLLQSEILQVLQYQQAQAARAGGQNQQNPYMHTNLPSPFLSRHDSFRSWRIDIDRRLYEWKESAPQHEEIGVEFSIDFFNLNYWQTVIMLYRQSLSVPAMFEGEYHTSKEVNSPSVHNIEPREDEDRIYLKVAEAGQKTLRLYRQLHIVGLVNYTYLATHHLFTAGISYLYAIWHSPIVRSRLSMDEVDFTMLAATSVFTDLIEKCPPAEACRDAFERTAKATIKMVNSIGGFGQAPHPAHGKKRSISSDRRSRDEIAPATNYSNVHYRGSASQQTQSQLRMTPDAFFSNPSPTSPSQTPHYRMSTTQHVKREADSFSGTPAFPGPPRGNAGSTGDPVTPDATAQDLSLMPSPTTARQAIPRGLSVASSFSGVPLQLPPIRGTSTTATTASTTPVVGTPTATAVPNFFPQQAAGGSTLGHGVVDLGELQRMDFLQSLGSGADGDFGGAGGDAQTGLNFGIGWDGGYHNDFSDGQQFDLFDGFFFGEPRGAGAGAATGAETEANGAGGAAAEGDDS